MSEAVELKTSDAAQTESRDIYDAINDLVDSLRAWSDNPTEAAMTDSQTVRSPDSLDLTELFPECEIVVDDSSGLTTISLPLYFDLLTTSLQIDKSNTATSDDHPDWIVPVVWDGKNIFVDGIPIPLSGKYLPDTSIVDHIRKRIVLFRTIGLPERFRSRFPDDDSAQVIVTVRGRDMIDIPFTLPTWLRSLSKIAAGMQVYSGLLDVAIDSTEAAFIYYMLITYPVIEGHHFIEWREHLIKKSDKLSSDPILIMFTPYIRTDNLKNLFAKPGGVVRDPIQLRIK